MGKVQGDKNEKMTDFLAGGIVPLRGGTLKSDYASHFREPNITKFGDFMFGIRFAFEYFGYKAIPMDKGKYSDVYKKAIYALVMENNISLQDFFNGRQIEFYDHVVKNGKLISVKARFIKGN